jgi:hypothetical protein
MERGKIVIHYKMNYVANVLIVKDPKVTDNEGKVFLYKFGVKIMDKIKDMIAPAFADVEAIDPFDPAAGANFRLRVVRNGNFPDYDKSAFDKPSPIGDEAVIQAAVKERRSLDALISSNNFKSYEFLKSKFEKITGIQEATATAR